MYPDAFGLLVCRVHYYDFCLRSGNFKPIKLIKHLLNFYSGSLNLSSLNQCPDYLHSVNSYLCDSLGLSVSLEDIILCGTQNHLGFWRMKMT